eukprot:GHVU01219601.1.p1 GENE.GHVU01219601.1~~GHVU01219601.1.p1  ORF type:complete len:131 (-),score=4.63 GHVU01219601.1:1354-1746(-)
MCRLWYAAPPHRVLKYWLIIVLPIYLEIKSSPRVLHSISCGGRSAGLSASSETDTDKSYGAPIHRRTPKCLGFPSSPWEEKVSSTQALSNFTTNWKVPSLTETTTKLQYHGSSFALFVRTISLISLNNQV